MKIFLPYQTALRAFRALQKLHRREVGGSMSINFNKKFEYATIFSGDKRSVSHPQDGEIIYHTHPDTRSYYVYHDPPSFIDILGQVRHALKQHMGKKIVAPQINMVFTNEGIYTIEVTNPQLILNMTKSEDKTNIDDILSSLSTMWKSQYRVYVKEMMDSDNSKIGEINQLLVGIKVELHPWTQIVKNRGLTLNLKLQELVKLDYNPKIIEPKTSPKPFIPSYIKPTI